MKPDPEAIRLLIHALEHLRETRVVPCPAHCAVASTIEAYLREKGAP